MSGFLDNFELADGTGWKVAAQAAPAALAGYQAIKAKRDYGNKVNEIETLMENRQQINNPYANMSNPFANLQVATKAAEMQAEQSDIALANTLDNLRQTGAGGATALAQAALQSKRGVSANIQQQEAQNQRLQAQGQQRVDLAKAQGQMQTMILQEKRTEADLTRLQDQADLLKAQEIYSTQSAMSSLGAAAQTLAGGIIPSQLPEGSGSTFTSGATEAANQAGVDLINNIKLMEVPEIPNFDFSLSADIFASPQGNTWQKSGLSNMVKERDRLRQAGQSTAEIQGLIDSTRQKFGI
jgi:hypothetical protein|tara:strand:+ start:42 stop:932 length:891 start_codon:yes stop_codon:yes gene_type:complete